MNKILVLLLLFLISCSSLHFSPVDRAPSAKDLPTRANQTLDPISYVELEVQKLSRARIVWLNFDLLREKGIQIDPNGLTPEFEKRLLDEFGYMVKNHQDSSQDFSPINKKVYADRYGGFGIGVNWGSGRAIVSGDYQIKGAGQTPLVGEGQTFDHAHGGASFKESIQEAVWGEFNHQELPFGSNRVLMIVDTGTYTKWEDGGRESRALIVREDPLRPAHYLQAYGGKGKFGETEAERLKANFKLLLKTMPLPGHLERSKLSDLEIIKYGLEEFIDRISQQFAATNARRIFHGGVSSSNIELSGKFLDFGTETSLSGFGYAKILDHVAAFPVEIADHIVQTLRPLREMAIEQLRISKGIAEKLFPPIEKYGEKLSKKFTKYLQVEVLHLTGVPQIINQKLATSDMARDFANALVELAYFDKTAVNVDKSMPPKLGEYPINRMLEDLALVDYRDIDEIRATLERFGLPEGAMEALPKMYHRYMVEAAQSAALDGIDEEGFKTLVLMNAKMRNRDLPDLYRSNMHARNLALIDRYKSDQNRSPIWDSINRDIESNRLTYKELAPYEAPSGVKYNHITGERQYLVFNAREKKMKLKVTIPTTNNEFYFYKNKVKFNSPNETPLIRYSENQWNSFKEVKGKLQGTQIVFELPIEHDASSLEMAMRSFDGKTWWKNENQNIKLPMKKKPFMTKPNASCAEMVKAFM